MRRLELYIPIVLLAVLVQLLAPIAAFRVVAYAVSDPLYMASICSGIPPSSDAETDHPAQTHSHGDCCAIAVDPPPLVFVTLQRQYQRISWLEAAVSKPAIRVGSNAQARAPPPLA